MNLTKPAKEKSHFTSHSDDFSGKEIYDVRFEPFNAPDGKTFINLTISAKSSIAGQTSQLVLHHSQIDMLEKAIKEYREKQFPFELIEV